MPLRTRRRPSSLFGLWADVAALGAEAQMVMGLRLAKIALGGPQAQAECGRMVGEKLLAAATLQQRLLASALTGKTHSAQRDAVRFYRARVRANRKRLMKGR